ncbi:hypothetical protein [Streptomyces sp. NPDC002057]|uniref:hypothetical protein n=1 Tax=Streptomyces sp. NPDC002057 TaxID=3154664 RepID=UPI00331FCE46
MDDGGWDGDEGREVLRRAERATRWGWTGIAGVTGLLGCALVAVVGGGLLVLVGTVYVLMAADR